MLALGFHLGQILWGILFVINTQDRVQELGKRCGIICHNVLVSSLRHTKNGEHFVPQFCTS